MHTLSLRAALLVASCLILPGQVLASTTTEAGTADAATTADQTSSANQAGQANDKNALTSSDIIVTGSRTAEAAPITASLTTTQPQAAVSREFIDSHVSASSDFNEIIALTPGVSITGTGNGAGFSESKATIRGFQDGEYNLTYDSIPFSDTNNPTHHSTAFFPSNTIETVVVDRGPGNASQLGQATYGGNLNIYSRAVKDEMGGQIEAISGIWNTRILRGEFQTGKIASLGDAQFVLAGQYLESDGALSYSPVQSKNIFAKAVIPLGPDNTLTLLATYNRNHYYQSDTAKGVNCGSAVAGAGGLALGTDGLPLAQLTGENCSATSLIAKYGKFYGMTNDPASTEYWKYNRTDKTTDFSIIRLQSNLGSGFSMDNRVYMYAYTNNTLSGQSGSVVTGFTTSNAGIISAVADKTGHIHGYDKGNKYRTIGYIGQLNYEFLLGKIRLGGWYEHASTDRRLLDLDLTTGLPSYSEKFNNGGGTAAALALPASSLANVRYLQHSGWNQYQLFGEFEFRPAEGLSITPGVKHVHFTRSIDALVNQTARTPNQSSATWKKTLPFATINWQLGSGFAVYGQYAQGMYVPDLSSFYSPSGSSTQQANQAKTLADLKPQTTTNYQVGAVWHGDKVSVDVDGYIINVDNKIATSTLATDPPNTLINIGQVRYRGVEGQISVMPLTGLTLFANASYNQAKSVTSGAQISKTPYSTSALGAFYNHNGFRMAYTQKFTGPQYATEFNGAAGPRKYRLTPYSVGDFSISQEIGEHFRIGLTVANVFNSQAITAISNSALVTGTVGGTSYTGYGQSDAFAFLPPRSAQVSVRIKF